MAPTLVRADADATARAVEQGGAGLGAAAGSARPRPGRPSAPRRAAPPGSRGRPAQARATTRRRTPTRPVARASGKTAAAGLAEQREPAGVLDEVVGRATTSRTTMIRSSVRGRPRHRPQVRLDASPVSGSAQESRWRKPSVASAQPSATASHSSYVGSRPTTLSGGRPQSRQGLPDRDLPPRPGPGRPPDSARPRPRTGSRVPPLPTPTRGGASRAGVGSALGPAG